MVAEGRVVSMRGSVPEFELPRGRSIADSVRLMSGFPKTGVSSKKTAQFRQGKGGFKTRGFYGYHEEES
jgi:hypothetical protein